MKSKPTIEIGYYIIRRDFGRFKSKETVTVPEAFWKEYIDARFKFEIMHTQLEALVKKKKN